MRLASKAERIHAAGGEVIAVSVDGAARQAGMFARWPTPHVRYVSDPGGERLLRALDLYDPDERDGIGRAGIVVVAPDGREAFRYRGRDFADRTHDDDALEALEALGLDPIEPPAGGPTGAVGDDLDGWFRPGDFGAWFRGNRSAAVAIGRRMPDAESRALAKEHRTMIDGLLEAWRQVRPR